MCSLGLTVLARMAEPGRALLWKGLLIGGQFLGGHGRAALYQLKFVQKGALDQHFYKKKAYIYKPFFQFISGYNIYHLLPPPSGSLELKN